MEQINTNRIVTTLLDNFGITFSISFDSQRIKIRPTDLEFGEGFTLFIKFEWRNLIAEFVPDNFAGALLKSMNMANTQE